MPRYCLAFPMIAAAALVGCGSAPVAHSPSAAAPPHDDSEYVTIEPDVSTYPARVRPKKPAPVDEHEDIMASILAIPPGQ